MVCKSFNVLEGAAGQLVKPCMSANNYVDQGRIRFSSEVGLLYFGITWPLSFYFPRKLDGMG